jgi:basic membrane protein A and related proteins
MRTRTAFAALSLLAACGGNAELEDKKEGIKVGLVVDGNLDDNTYNKRVLDGCMEAASEFGLQFDYVVSNPDDYLKDMRAFADSGYQHIISVAFLSAEATATAAKEFPDVNFAILDFNYEDYPDNLQGYAFREDEGGFMAGTLAGLHSQKGKKTVACLGGIEIPAIKRFCNGFANGAKRVCEDCETLITYTGSFSDEAVGKQAAEAFIAQDADVIFGAAGLTGSAGIKYGAEHGAWVIGVDNDEFFGTFKGGDAAGADHLLSSVIKRADTAAYRSIEASHMESFESGSVVLGLADDAFAMAPWHLADERVDADMRKAIDDAIKGLADGSIKTGVDPATGDLKP